ncbi:SRPBCC family protein [Geomonas sp. RF6]|uniref:SRPBCC family protein n=1 Tax=Geomonas sp. RF6 TaxID=2897342 RepID=UPI001E4632D5|nr:SRPBCC family protein [Geomonas sp. RF6]UFS72115.1 SRPBCC family protein [Geomonas sp. RF6]
MVTRYGSSFEEDSKGRQINVGSKERKASMIGGAALAITGVKKLTQGNILSGLLMLASGGMFYNRGKSGHCNMYQKMGVNTARDVQTPIRLEKVVTINRTPQQVYDFWRDLENLPKFMNHLESVQVRGPVISHWKAVGAGGLSVEWDAEIVQDIPGQKISWQSIGEADVANEGTVRFEEAPGNRGTEVHVLISYTPPGGAVGKAAARFLQTVNAVQLEQDLKRLKQILETGVTATAESWAM